MKKIYIILICLLFLIIGCKKEEKLGDITTNHNDYLMSNIKELDVLNYHIKINSINEGMSYHNTIFSFLVNNNDGIYIYNYNNVTNNIDLNNYIDSITIGDKEYKYYLNNDNINLIYNIDDNYYLSLSIKDLYNEIDNNENIIDLLELFDFEITKK